MSRQAKLRRCAAVIAALAFCGLQPAMAAAPPAAPPAAPLDPLSRLAADVSAVLDVGAMPRLQLSETDNGVSATRTLAVGDEYRDGWTVAAIDSTSVTLRKGKEVRTVALTGRRPAPAASSIAPPSAPATALVTNAVLGGSGAQDPAARAAGLAAAIQSGGVSAILTAGGSARDVATVMVKAIPPLPSGGTPDPSTAAFVQVNGQRVVAMLTDQGARFAAEIFDDSAFAATGAVAALPTMAQAFPGR